MVVSIVFKERQQRMTKSLLILISVSLLLFNCKSETQQTKKDLELEIITDSLTAYCKDGDCSKTGTYSRESQDKSRNLIEFKLTNNTKTTFAVIPVCDSFADIGCSTFDGFPNKYSNLDLNTLIIKDNENNTIIDSSWPLVNYAWTDIYTYETVKDSIETEYYRKIGMEHKSREWKQFNLRITEKTIIIHPNETLFFTSFIMLPHNVDINNRGLQKLQLDTNKNYSAQLYLISNLDSIKNYLTDTQRKTFETNNYIHYTKPLVSINSIPIKFKK